MVSSDDFLPVLGNKVSLGIQQNQNCETIQFVVLGRKGMRKIF